MKIYKRLLYLGLALTFLIVFNAFSISANELTPTTTLDTANTGSYSIVLPTTEDNVDDVYAVTLGLISVHANGSYISRGDEVYYVRVTDENGEINTDLSSYYKFTASWNNVHGLSETVVTIPNIPEGSTVTVENILVIKTEYYADGSEIWSNYVSSYMAATVAHETEIVLIDDENDLKELVVGQSVSQTASVQEESNSGIVRETDDTLLSLSGYSSYEGNDFLTYLLSAYNVVSLDEINSTHIVGPIIAQNTAERTADSSDGTVHDKLAASDYSNGVSSYIGDFSIYDETNISVTLNYIVDVFQNPYFTAPYLYSDEVDLEIVPTGETSNLLDYYLVEGYDNKVLSSNNSGLTYTYQNDDFIDFTALETALINASEYISTNGNAEDYEEYIKFEFDTDGTVAGSTIKVYEGGELVAEITATNGEVYDGRDFDSFVSDASYANDVTGGIRLTINMEESWTIINADNLLEVDLILPEDYDYYDNPYLLPTTINFECEYINPTLYEFTKDLDGDGIEETVSSIHSVMPYTLINGAEFTASLGENGEYGEVGNKIIWNMPNLVTDSETGDNRLTVLERAHNIAGHIVAPQAEFWNYDENGNWLGGNLNGTAIVKSFYSGTMEMHMWAYTGLAEEAVVFGVEATKTVNGELPTSEFTFVLDVEYNSDGSIPDGIMNNTFPMYANSSTDTGAVKFSTIAFSEAGTYTFILKEDTSMDTATDNVTYDLTEYKLVITVGKSSESTEEVTIYEITDTEKYKIVDSDGTTLETPELLYEDLDVIEFSFDNTTTDTDTVNLTLYKYCTTGHILPGAKFYISEMNDNGSDVVTNGYYESVTSDNSGKINITGLEKSTYYKIWEYEAAAGHVKADGYWVVYIDSNGFLSSITAHDGAPAVGSDLIIYNEPEDTALLDLILTKSNEALDLLSGVEFRLQQVVLDPYGVPQTVTGGYDKTYTTAEDGTFSVLDLEAGYVYMLSETSTPVGHRPHTGYWLIEVTGNSLHPSDPLTYTITEYDSSNKVVSTSTNDVIYNELIDYVLPTTGGIGNTIFYITGTVLMVSSVIIYTKKKRIIKG